MLCNRAVSSIVIQNFLSALKLVRKWCFWQTFFTM